MEGDFHAREDLMQEALLHLWREERQHPDQKLSWYLQSCKFHLEHYRVCGRSLDSLKHRSAQAPFPDCYPTQDGWLASLSLEEDILSEINARDVIALLQIQLEPIDQAILGASAQGLKTGEIAHEFELSHQSVRRHRLRIALTASRLGVLPGQQ